MGGLTSVIISGDIISVSDSLFSHCSNMKTVSLPESVTSIGLNAFDSCSSLVAVTLSEGLSSIGEYAFQYCSSLTQMNLPSSLIYIGRSAFNHCSSLTEIDIPKGVTRINGYTFTSCSSLAIVTLPSTVTSIEDQAFVLCRSLTEIIIPEKVNDIKFAAFSGCDLLTRFTFMGDAPAVGIAAFESVGSGFTFYYLSGSSGFTSPTWSGHPSVMIDENQYPAASWLLTHHMDYDTGLNQDLNSDGVSLLMAYALNLNPNIRLTGDLPQVIVSGSSMNMTFYGLAQGVSYRVETSENLIDWDDSDVIRSNPDASGLVTAMADVEASNAFMRLVVIQ